jgi:hypothetical protein
MADSNSIIDLGKISEPATVLIQKISDAIGGLSRPWQIVRVAEAQAKADKIDAVAKIEITELQQRAMRRMILEEERKQNNIEEIIAKALPQLEDNAAPKNIEDDWIANFFDKCRLISDENMQQLWSKVLAGEANSPGKFSKRTVALLASLDKSEAEFFTSVCRFICSEMVLLYDEYHQIYTSHGVSIGILHHLTDVGLLKYEPLTGFGIEFARQSVPLRYFGREMVVTISQPLPFRFDIGKVYLTKSGGDLASVCASTEVPRFVDYLTGVWRGKNFAVQIRAAEAEATAPPPQ